MRREWVEALPGMDPEKLVFIDETWTSTSMTRRCGRAPKGQRCIGSAPHGHWKTTTFVGALRRRRLTAPMVTDGPMDGEMFSPMCANSCARRCSRETSLFSTTSAVTRCQALSKPSMRRVQFCSICRPTLPTSTPSRNSSLNSKRCFAKLPNEPSIRSGTRLESC
jgi:hypothetical protein